MDATAQQKAIDSLRDWSKWLIGLDFGGVAGCVLIFVQSPESIVVTPFLVIAIALFGLSMGSAILLIRELAYLTELLPVRDETGQPDSILSHRGETRLTIGSMASLQLGLLAAAALAFMIWVVARAIAP